MVNIWELVIASTQHPLPSSCSPTLKGRARVKGKTRYRVDDLHVRGNLPFHPWVWEFGKQYIRAFARQPSVPYARWFLFIPTIAPGAKKFTNVQGVGKITGSFNWFSIQLSRQLRKLGKKKNLRTKPIKREQGKRILFIFSRGICVYVYACGGVFRCPLSHRPDGPMKKLRHV